ncbi:MAG: uroporphyrinogen decarboxylase family protein, partial [Oscillospiraceae bacterium]|nr:uroporphyrinogen decarboxylase family protein [Oscillospiraceae bacterium]
AFLLSPWAWRETLARWRGEGLPEGCDLSAHFGTDAERIVPLTMQGPYGPYLNPPFEVEILSDGESSIVQRDVDGSVVRLFKDDRYRSMPQWVSYPMRGREDWETLIKPRLDASVPGRRPEGGAWDEYVGQAKSRDYPLGMWCGSLYGWPRSLMGVEGLSYAMHDDPALVREMCEHIADFVVETITPILRDIELDYAFIWEDMAGKCGPLCSPAAYREFMGGPLRRITEVLRKHGVRNVIIDSDGNNDVMIPLWLELGVNGLRPFEVAAGCDPVASRKLYGRDLIIQGGIDKRALAGGRQAIDKEVLSKVPWLCMQGGYFPQVDHLTPPDVPLADYEYYSGLLRKVADDPERYLGFRP